MRPERTVYLDHAATTPMRPAALEAMLPFYGERYANPSGSHRLARDARLAVDEARDVVAAAIGCAPGEIVFTSGGTEADNAAITGWLRRHGGVPLCSAVEHHAVLEVVERAGGAKVGVDATGRIDLGGLAAYLDGTGSPPTVAGPAGNAGSQLATEPPAGTVAVERVSTAGASAGDVSAGRASVREVPTGSVPAGEVLAALVSTEHVSIVSVMAVNNEVGTVQPLADAAALVRRARPDAAVHTDAVQAASWLDLRDVWRHVDLLSLSAHKFGGPKGVGVLAVRSGIDLYPLLLGGGQERDRRSGTHNVAGIVAMAEALRLTDEGRVAECARISGLRARLVEGVHAAGGVTETVPVDAAVPGIVHLRFSGVENEALLFLLDEAGVCASAASACASGAMEPSHVLAAMGVPVTDAVGALRLSMGHTTTDDDIDHAIQAITAALARLRR